MATTLARSTPGSRFDAEHPRRASSPARVTRPEQLRVALFSGNYNVTVDGANLQPGTSEARVIVSAPDGVTVREVQPASVSVTLARP